MGVAVDLLGGLQPQQPTPLDPALIRGAFSISWMSEAVSSACPEMVKVWGWCGVVAVDGL